MNYEAAMAYIENTAKFGSNLGLERTEKILEFLGNPHEKIKCIHVAGTNGKGSTSAMINKILIQAGYKVGMYTSPYLEEFEERIQINGNNIEKDELAYIVTQVSKAADKVIELGYDHPTEFEIITCAMFLYFSTAKVDFAVVEVGLGGRLDSTNVLHPILSIITSISLDHTNILGGTFREIAYEKAGIIKAGVPVISYPQNSDAEKVISSTCDNLGCDLTKVELDSAKFLGTNGFSQRVKINTGKDIYEFNLSLLGKHQLVNCSVAISAIERLIQIGVKVSKENITDALGKVRWIGRLEVLKEAPLVVIDGAHNIGGITELKESVHAYFKYERMILIIGILKDKQVEDMIKTIVPGTYKVISVTPNSCRAENSDELNKIIKKYNKNSEAYDDYYSAYKKALEISEENDLILVCGSLYMIGDMRKIIRTWP